MNHKYAVDPNSSWNGDPEYEDLDKSTLPLSPIFNCQMKEFRPPLPKYHSWLEITKIYNKYPSNKRSSFAESATVDKFYTRNSKGYMVLSDQEIINSQKGILKDIISEALSKFSFTKGFTDFSLPVKIFSLKTQMEMIPEMFGHTQYLHKAIASLKPGVNDPQVCKQMRVKRLKWIVNFMMAGIHHTIQTKKPFNLYIGETFQARFDDGTEVYIEHTKHYPAIDSFYIVNEHHGFKIYGAMKLLSGSSRV